MSRLRALLPVGLLFVVLAAIYVSTARTGVVNVDASSSSISSWRIAATGAPWLDGVNLRDIPRRFTSVPLTWIGEAESGHTVAFRSAGPVLAAVPAYWLLNRTTDPARFDIAPGSWTAAVLVAAAMTCFYVAMRRYLRKGQALAATAALALTTPVWSVAADALWTHSVTVLGIAGMAAAAARERWWLVGLLGGVGLWGRPHVAVIVALVGLGVAWSQRRPAVAVQVGLPSLGMLGLLMAWNRYQFGRLSPEGAYSGANERVLSVPQWTDALVNQAGLWFSPIVGVFVWTPVLLILLVAVVRSWRALPAWSRWMLLGGLLYVVVQGQLNAFLGGSGFYGYRLTLEFLAAAAPACVLAARHLSRRTLVVVGALIGLQFGAISIGAVMNGWLVREEFAWERNGFVLALRYEPELGIWAGLTTLIGVLLTLVLASRWRPPA